MLRVAVRSTSTAVAASRSVATQQQVPLRQLSCSHSAVHPTQHSKRAVKSWQLSATSNLALRSYATKTYPKHIKVPMPALSPTMTSGNIGKWNKKVGDSVVPGDVLVEIETDKATMDFEIQEEGHLAKIFIKEGAKDIPVNQLLAVLAENKADLAAFQDYPADESAPAAPAAAPAAPAAPTPAAPTPAAAPAPAASTPAPAAAPAPTPAPAPTSSSSSTDRILVSPVAKKIAEERHISLTAIKGTGPHGRILKEDVLNYVPAPAAAATPAAPATPAPKPASTGATTAAAAEYTDVPVTKIRQIIAQRLTESKQKLPHYYLTVDINVDKVNALRQSFNAKANDKYKLSVNDFVIKAAAKALLQVPEVNTAWMGDFLRRFTNADISVAVATDAGLITPIVFSANNKGLVAISEQVKKLAAKARENKLAPNEYQGGSFSISNLGMFGIKEFTAIINPPQSCILAVGASEKRIIPSDKAPNGFETATIMTVTLSCDHRVVDGAVGAQWLQSFKGYMEDPITLLL